MGLSHQDDTEIHALVLMRTIDGLKTGMENNDDKAGLYYTAPEADRQLLTDLRAAVKIGLSPDPVTISEYTVPWLAGGIQQLSHTKQIRNIASEFVVNVQKQIQTGLLKRRPLNDTEREWVHHQQFAYHRAENFCGREDIIKNITALLSVPESTVRCVYGRSGAGKTSAMFAAAAAVYPRLSDSYSQREDPRIATTITTATGVEPVVICRACGTSAKSSSAKDLIASLCLQIARVYDTSTTECIKFEEQVVEFRRMLGCGSEVRPLYLFIDSLDQLSDKDFGRSQPWRWLPQPPQPQPQPQEGANDLAFTSIVVSVLPDAVDTGTTPQYGILTALQSVLPPASLAEVPLLPQREAMAVLDEWMSASHRSLQPAQRASVERDLAAADAITMLHIRLVHDRVGKWKSYDEPDHLPASVVGLIHLIFDHLESLHGPLLVSKVMGCLAASKHGLSVANLIDLVSCDDEVLGKTGQAGAILQWHEVPIRRLPPLVFARLRNDLGGLGLELVSIEGIILSQYKSLPELSPFLT